MPSRQPLPPSVAQPLNHQHGVLTVAQLLDAGLTRRVCERVTADWDRLARGLYLARTPTFESAAWAASLYTGPNAVLGSSAAAYLNGVLRDPPSEIVVWDGGDHEPINVGAWRTRPRRGVRAGRGAPARLAVEQSLLDLTRDNSEIGTVDAVARALSRRLTTPERLLAALDDRTRTRHGARIRGLCSAGKAGIESALEWLFGEVVLAAHRLPTPERQVTSSEGRIDCRFSEFGVIVELDGIRDHTKWSKDMFRDNAHAIRLDSVTLRYGWHAVVYQACLAAEQLEEALALRGWKGRRRRCRRCPERSPLAIPPDLVE